MEEPDGELKIGKVIYTHILCIFTTIAPGIDLQSLLPLYQTIFLAYTSLT